MDTKKILLATAENHRTEREILIELASSPDPEIRSAVARNPRFASRIEQFGLNTDSDATVRRAAAENPDLFSRVLLSLVTDEDASVREAAEAGTRRLLNQRLVWLLTHESATPRVTSLSILLEMLDKFVDARPDFLRSVWHKEVREERGESSIEFQERLAHEEDAMRTWLTNLQGPPPY